MSCLTVRVAYQADEGESGDRYSLLIAREPLRLRVAMIPAVLEKLAFGVPAIVLYAQHRLSSSTLAFGLVDLLLGALFVVAYVGTRAEA